MRPFFIRCIGFFVVFSALQSLWGAARGTWVERLWIDHLTVQSATAMVSVLTPTVQARPLGARIVAPGGGLNILNGCERTEVLFLLAAALCVAPLSLRSRLHALLSGFVCVFALNLLRILVLFYAYRFDRGLFDLLHTTIAPLILIALTGLFFHLWLAWSMRGYWPRSEDAGRAGAPA